MRFFQSQRALIIGLATASVVYALAVMWYVPTQPCIPLGCLLVNPSNPQGRGLEIRDASHVDAKWGEVPVVGDLVVAAAGDPIRSFSDWVRVHRRLRSEQVVLEAVHRKGRDLTEQSEKSNISLAEEEETKRRLVRVLFVRPGKPGIQESWIYLSPTPMFSVSLTLVWLVLELCVLVVGGMAYWNRPNDQPVRTFVALCALSMVAFVGGSHWWIIAGSPLLVSIFAICATLLPATLLHFFLIHPVPSKIYARSPGWCRVGLYALPTLLGTSLAAFICSTWWLAADYGPGPFGDAVERISGGMVVSLMPLMRRLIYLSFAVALVYFGLSLLAIRRGVRDARNALEHQQARFIQWAGVFAIVPIGVTVYQALFHEAEFALGSARIPMFLASLAFMVAYAVGIARYKLLLIDQVVSRGVWYYCATAGLALLFATLVAAGAVQAMQQEVHFFGLYPPLLLVLMTSVLVLISGRDALQRELDRRFFREKYQLDKALQRMNRVTANALEPEAVSNSLLTSCRDVLHVDQVALYVRKGNRLEFRMAASLAGKARFPLQIVLEADALEALMETSVLQRVPQLDSPAQTLLRQLHAEVVHALDGQGMLNGLIVLGGKRGNAPYSAEDLAFVSALARTTGVALQCATVQQDVVRLNQDLQLKIEKIADQDRQLSALRNELSAIASPAAPQLPNEEFQRAGIKGHGPAMTSVLETTRKVASSNSSVLLRGESGTGKELLARAIHENSPRRKGPLVSVHCGALSPTLLESELFGHVKGAFTDARSDKIGRFQMADGGTLFLDEIGDISLEVQVKLLRVLQEREFEPVGGTKPVAVDVRIVAATHRPLEQLISEGLFREDLFYRLNVISLTLPPLRERKEDLYELALHFLRQASERSNKQVLTIDDDALRVLQNHSWPGNIRELQNAIERATVLAEGATIRVEDLSADVRAAARPLGVRGAGVSSLTLRPTQVTLRRTTLPEQGSEKNSLLAALQQCQGNKAEAARLLGLPRSTFFSKLKKHGIS